MLEAVVPSSTYFTEIVLLFNGLGIEGLKNAPLNFTMKMRHPRTVPWGPPPGRGCGGQTLHEKIEQETYCRGMRKQF